MSRTIYLKRLEDTVSASQKVIDELCRENYELKRLLEHVAKNHGTTKPTQTFDAAHS